MTVEIVVLSSGCGFRLRGDWQLDDNLLPVSVYDGGSETKIMPRLLRELKNARIPVADKGKGNANIELMAEAFKKRLLTSNEEATIDTYDVEYRLRYQVKSGGKALIPWQTLTLNRILQFSQAAVLSSATEEDTLRDDLVDDAVDQILTRLRFLQPAQPLSAPPQLDAPQPMEHLGQEVAPPEPIESKESDNALSVEPPPVTDSLDAAKTEPAETP